jgi:hypothetical protein
MNDVSNGAGLLLLQALNAIGEGYFAVVWVQLVH